MPYAFKEKFLEEKKLDEPHESQTKKMKMKTRRAQAICNK